MCSLREAHLNTVAGAAGLDAGSVVTGCSVAYATYVPHARVPNGQSRSLTGTSPPLASTVNAFESCW
jgi:hypothetical protein